MAVLDKEELKELLYLELVLSQQVEQVMARLKKAGRDLKALGDALEKHPLLSPLGHAGNMSPCQDNHFFSTLLRDGRVYSLAAILADMASLKRQRGMLEDIQKRLLPVRNPGKTW